MNGMIALLKLLMLAVYLAVGMIDILILLVTVHLLRQAFPANRFLCFLDEIGAPAVSAATQMIFRRLKQHWDPPLSHSQQELVALGGLLVARWVLAFFIV